MAHGEGVVATSAEGCLVLHTQLIQVNAPDGLDCPNNRSPQAK
jgi:hypothetical protein